jgi:DNA polymerase-4
MLRWLVLDLNGFFASCEQQDRPELRGQPIIVVPLMAETTCAIAASYPAKAFGIKTGTRVADARRLCPGLRVVQARPKRYVEYHHEIVAAVEDCAPVADVMSIDEMACLLDRSQQQPDAARTLALAMKASIRNKVGDCLTASVGIAPNRLLAKLASDMQKPDGLTLLPLASLPQAIIHLNPGDICGIGPRMAARLQRAGINTMNDLWQADGQQLRRIWGGLVGLRFHALLHGADLPFNKGPRRSLGHQHVLAPELRTLAGATPVIRQLLVRAAQRLREENYYCSRLLLDIKWQGDVGHYYREAEFCTTQNTSTLLSVLMPLWLDAPKLRPLRVGVTLAGLEAAAQHQPDLFELARPAALTAAIDRINGKYGRSTIAYGTAMPDMVAKIAFQRVPGLAEF